MSDPSKPKTPTDAGTDSGGTDPIKPDVKPTPAPAPTPSPVDPIAPDAGNTRDPANAAKLATWTEQQDALLSIDENFTTTLILNWVAWLTGNVPVLGKIVSMIIYIVDAVYSGLNYFGVQDSQIYFLSEGSYRTQEKWDASMDQFILTFNFN